MGVGVNGGKKNAQHTLFRNMKRCGVLLIAARVYRHAVSAAVRLF